MHRKVIEITIKVVLDVDTDNFEGEKHSDEYNEELNDAIDDFVTELDYEIHVSETVSIARTEIVGHEVKI